MDYIDKFYQSYYPGLTIQMLIGAVVLAALVYVLARRHFRKADMSHSGLKAMATMTAALYYYMVLLSTVFTRPKYAKRNYELELFWSYKKAFAGDRGLALEIVLNIILFMPLGFLIAYVMSSMEEKLGRSKYRRVVIPSLILLGAICSAVIEVLQLLLCRGLFEWDDIWDNTLGFVIGICLCYRVNRRGRW